MISRFVFCETRNHGHFLFSDGRRSEEILSKEQGIRDLNLALDMKLIVPMEHLELLAQVWRSGLPHESEAEPIGKFCLKSARNFVAETFTVFGSANA